MNQEPVAAAPQASMTATALHHAGLVLRPFVDSDAEDFAAAVLESVDTVGPWMGWATADYTVVNAQDWFAACRAGQAAGTAFEFGVFCESTGQFLGGAGLNDIRSVHKFCNLGYWVRSSRQGQGVAPRCVHALSVHAFEVLGLHRVEIVVAVGNTASERVAMKCGALRESVARNRLIVAGQPAAVHMFSLAPDGRDTVSAP